MTLAILILAGLASVFMLSRWLDNGRVTFAQDQDESLYLSGPAVKRMSLACNGLVADWYWMRSLQYVGKKILGTGGPVPLDDLGALNLKLLPSLLDSATTLDPQFLEPYEYAAIVLPAINVNEAIRITKKGIAANPNAWRLYQHLGYIYWQQGDFKTAGETYAKGAAVPYAPEWMRAMQARMADEGGSRHTAREIYTRMFEQTTDEYVRDMARNRLLQLDSLDEREVLHKVLSSHSQKYGRCPTSWREIAAVLSSLRFRLNAIGEPLDPSGIPYILRQNGCIADLNPGSTIPTK